MCSYRRHESIWRSGGTAPLILNLSMDGGEELVRGTGRFPPGESVFCVH